MNPTEQRTPEVDHDQDTGDSPEIARQQRGVFILLAAVMVVAAIALAVHYWPKGEKKEKVDFAPAKPSAPVAVPAIVPKVTFKDITADAGIDFVHETGAEGQKLLPETMGSGAAFFDYDNDGDPDLFLVNSRAWKDVSNPATQRFYRNDGGRFTDVTADVGLALTFYGQGTAIGDFDDDGFTDLYVTCVGENHLFKNEGGKRFVDVTTASGVGGGDSWSTSAGFLDFDRDGKLDLFVADYVEWSPEIDIKLNFTMEGLGRAYGPPFDFKGTFSKLFRNAGGGRFEDVSEGAGINRRNPATSVPMGKSLGVCITDLDGDGWPDIVVANDTVQNFAFMNRKDGTFEDKASSLALAFDERGNARGAMGIDSADIRNNGGIAVVVGNFANETDAFFVSDDGKQPLFIDLVTSVGLAAATRQSLTFGVLLLDFDLDGRLDYVTANGHVEPDISRVQRSQQHAQSVELFWNAGPDGAREFVQVTASDSGPDLFEPIVGRSLASADIDGDGDLDLLVTQNGGKTKLFRNDITAKKSLRLDLRTGEKSRTAFGASVVVKTSAGVQRRYLGGARSYLAQSEPVLSFGLGDAEATVDLEVTWPDGKTQVFEKLPPGLHRLAQ